ncbi:MAG TPA: hypothetical protein EYP36_06045 [Calditrichaeota bacterium]|nr:hypothetical protein [Calditrichota bacterium]
MRTKTVIFFWVLVIKEIVCPSLKAQDSHYWSDQYGTRADLLGGIVIGSVKDLSSVYYNPGAVSFSAERSLVISTHAFDVTFIDLGMPIMEGKNYKYSKTRVAPAIFAIRLNNPLNFTKSFVISYVEKKDDEKEFDLLNLPYAKYDNPPELIENTYNEIAIYNNIGEHWVGATLTYTYHKKLGIGFTFYGAYRNQESKARLVIQNVDSTGAGLSFDKRANFEIDHLRLFAKFGIFYEEKNFSLGLTMILPSLDLFGRGNLQYLNSDINVYKEDSRYSSIVNVNQSSLHASYKFPWSIGLGGAYNFGNSKCHFSIEYFTKIQNYKMLDANPFIDPQNGQMVELDVYSSAQSVLNYGIGFQHHIEPNLDLYIAVRTDFSSQYETNFDVLGVTGYNKYHITSGTAFKAFEYYITMGLSYGFGSSSSTSIFSKILPNPIGDDNENGEIDVKYESLKLILGFSF